MTTSNNEDLPVLETKCEDCKGTGFVYDDECRRCEATGYIPTDFGKRVLECVSHWLYPREHGDGQ